MSDGAPIAPAGVEKLWPLIRPISRQNRAFMNRVVSAAMDAGIRQFVDLGSGVPTAGNAKTRRTGRARRAGHPPPRGDLRRPGDAGPDRPVTAGSWLALTHGTCRDDAPPDRAAEVRRFIEAYQATSSPAWLRSAEELLPWSGGRPLLPPGMTSLPDWRPEPADLHFP